MNPPRPQSDFSTGLLDALNQAFNEVRAVICAHHPLRDDSKDAALSRTLIVPLQAPHKEQNMRRRKTAGNILAL